MSLETLLEAARFVEQQELRAQQFQHHQHQINNNQINRAPPQPPVVQPPQQQQQQQPQQPPPQPFKIVSSIVAPLTVSHTQLTQTTPATLVAVPQVPNLIHATTNAPVPTPRPPGPTHQVQNTPVMVSTQPGVVEVIQKPITVHPQQIQTINPTTPFEKALLIEDAAPSIQDLKKRNHQNTATGMMRSGTREVHNKLEKNRRAHLKECFELLKKQLPQQQDEKKTSNLSILHSALRYIQGLKKKERENEHEMERLARDKIASQQRLAALKKELGPQWDNIDLTLLQPPEPPLLAIATTTTTSPVMTMTLSPPQNPIKEELYDSDEPMAAAPATILTNGTTNTVITSSTNATAQLSVPMLPLPQVGYPVSQGLVLGVQKVALVSSKNLPLVSSPIAHIIPQLNGKVVPLAQYLMKPVVVVSTPNQGNTNITPRPS